MQLEVVTIVRVETAEGREEINITQWTEEQEHFDPDPFRDLVAL